MTDGPTPSWPAASSPAPPSAELVVDGFPAVGGDDDLGLRDERRHADVLLPPVAR